MANNKYTYEINLDTKGYVDGVEQGKEANADFTTSIKKVKDNLPNLKKELNAARKEAQGLALAYSKLSEQEKNSGFGKALARELDAAKQRTAELTDMTGDLQQEIKNMASDTAGWDALKEGISFAKDGMIALIGTTAQLAGKEKELQPLIAKIAQVQGVANAAIGIGNALQKQSAVMLGIRRVQELALTKAINLEKNATIGATVAQRAFNTVAKANPYVLLATAVIAVGTALAAYVSHTNKATDAEKKHNDELRQRQKEWNGIREKIDTAGASIVAKYMAMRIEWNNLATAHDKAKWVDNSKKKLEELGLSVKNVSDAEMVMSNMTDAVVKALLARAKAAAAYNLMVETIEKHLKETLRENRDNSNKVAKAGQKITEEEAKAVGIMTKDVVGMSHSAAGIAITVDHLLTAEEAILVNQYRQQKAREKQREILARQKSEINNITALYTNLSKEAIEANKKLGKFGIQDNPADKIVNHTDKEIKAAKDSITALEKEISTLQQKMKDGLVPKADIQKTLDRISNLQNKVKALKIEYGFEKPEKAKTKLQQLTEELAKHQEAYVIAVDANDESAKEAAKEAYLKTQKELDNYKASITIEADTDLEAIERQKKEISQIVSDALSTVNMTSYHFDALPLGDIVREAADKAIEELERVEDAQQKLNDIMNDTKSSDASISAAQDGLDALHEKWQQLISDLDMYQVANDEVAETNKHFQEVSNTIGQIGDAVQSTARLFGALGEASDDANMKAAGIVAEAVATIALSFAKALTTAKTWVDWLAFGASGLATMISMISQVRSATAGSYAKGGVIPGSSYSGDKLTAYVNSGERVLTARQNESFEKLVDAIDGNKVSAIGRPSTVYVTGKIQGKDLLLVQKNANKIMSKSGQNIIF